MFSIRYNTHKLYHFYHPSKTKKVETNGIPFFYKKKYFNFTLLNNIWINKKYLHTGIPPLPKNMSEYFQERIIIHFCFFL